MLKNVVINFENLFLFSDLLHKICKKIPSIKLIIPGNFNRQTKS